MSKVDLSGIIQLPHFRFPQHHLIQEWLNGTDYSERFFLVLIEAEHTSPRGGIKRISTPALEPFEGPEKFMMALRGDDKDMKMSEMYTQIILDFHKK